MRLCFTKSQALQHKKQNCCNFKTEQKISLTREEKEEKLKALLV